MTSDAGLADPAAACDSEEDVQAATHGSTPGYIGKYRYVRDIGQGSFAKVVLVKHPQTRVQFACKMVTRDGLVTRGIFDRFEREVRILSQLAHPSVVSVADVVYLGEHICVIMEYCPGGDLFSRLCAGHIPAAQIRTWFAQIAQGLAYIHQRGIAHRDLKPENILIDAEGRCKIADFGLCTDTLPGWGRLVSTPVGSTFYSCPELLASLPYDALKADMWSLGVVLFVMIVRKLPWGDGADPVIIKRIVDEDIAYPSIIPPEICGLLKRMLERVPANRITAAEVLQHPWVSPADPVRPPDAKEMRLRGGFRSARVGSLVITKSRQELVDPALQGMVRRIQVTNARMSQLDLALHGSFLRGQNAGGEKPADGR